MRQGSRHWTITSSRKIGYRFVYLAELVATWEARNRSRTTNSPATPSLVASNTKPSNASPARHADASCPNVWKRTIAKCRRCCSAFDKRSIGCGSSIFGRVVGCRARRLEPRLLVAVFSQRGSSTTNEACQGLGNFLALVFDDVKQFRFSAG